MDDHFCVNGPAWLEEGPRALGCVQSVSWWGQAPSVAMGAMAGAAPGAVTVWLRLSTCCPPSLPFPSLQVPALGFLAGTGRARGFIRRWLKKEKPTQQITQILAVPPLLLYSSEVQVLK